jgi:hypothetical protein
MVTSRHSQYIPALGYRSLSVPNWVVSPYSSITAPPALLTSITGFLFAGFWRHVQLLFTESIESVIELPKVNTSTFGIFIIWLHLCPPAITENDHLQTPRPTQEMRPLPGSTTVTKLVIEMLALSDIFASIFPPSPTTDPELLGSMEIASETWG